MKKTCIPLFVISGPSGVGKGTLCKRLLSSIPGLVLSVSMTSRLQRPEEQEGVDYYFVQHNQFEAKIESGEFLEWAKYNGNYYGTPRWSVEKMLAQGKKVLLEIDVQGALQVKSIFPEACLIFLEPPSLEELDHRLHGRGTNTEEDIQRRLAIGKKELALKEHFNYVVINNEIEKCQADVTHIIEQVFHESVL